MFILLVICPAITAGAGPEVDFQYHAVLRTQPTSVNVVDILPDSTPSVTVGEPLYAEYWATDSGAINTGVVSAYVDLSFEDSCLATTEDDITFHSPFTQFVSGFPTRGLVDELGASQLNGGVGSEPLWVKVATITFATTSACTATFALSPAASESSAFGRGVIDTDSIDYGDLAEVVILPAAEPCAAHADCADLDLNGVRDDNCVWWACDAGQCVGTDITFADMGGQFGACAPDGTADGNDRFHALNCFADSDNGTPGAPYPCEVAPPSALNVDAGGPFGSCDPDGVCDGNDAFAALNAFAGSSSCSCPLDGAPAPQQRHTPAVVDTVFIELVVSDAHASDGDVVTVDVTIRGGVADLRGYQLHAVASSGLDLIDLFVERRPDYVFDGVSTWQAFNVNTAQLLVGTDGPGIAWPADTGYLGTLVYRVIDRRDELWVDLLHDDHDTAQRTFLFPTRAQGKIAIADVAPATITIGRN